MYDPDMNAPPINPLPWVIILLVCLIGGAELVFQAGENGFAGGAQGIAWRGMAAERLAFSDKLFDWMRLNGTYSRENMFRFVGYIFVHRSLMESLFAIVLILAIGKSVAETMSAIAVITIFLLSAAIGAAIVSFILDDPFAMIGAYPAVYGLLGAYTWLLFTRLNSEGENGLRAFSLILALIGISIAFMIVGWLVEGVPVGRPNVWLTRLTGFGVGFVLSIALAPDGTLRLQKMLALIRQR